MSVALQDIKSLLKEVEKIQKHQQEIEKIKGETFNIFSILGVETKENKTHSNFIAELLNPKGSHYMGKVFLDEFLKEINYTGKLDSNTAEVFTEFYIGPVKYDSGGRIDIFIKDKAGNCISVENKIHAGDQENQLIRYSNHQKPKNTLYYLTLFGAEASEHSTEIKEEGGNKTKLEEGKDYFAIGYNKEVLNWLKACHQIAVDIPQLRDSIKQYILLIKKLTNQMTDPNNTIELKKAIFEKAEAAKYIADNFERIKNEVKEKFRKDVFRLLEKKLKSDLFKLQLGVDVSKNHAPILIDICEIKEMNPEFRFGIEPFSGKSSHQKHLFVGIVDNSGLEKDFLKCTLYSDVYLDLEGATEVWLVGRFIKLSNEKIHLDEGKFLQKLVESNEEDYNEIVEEVVEQSLEFIEDTYSVIIEYFEGKKK